MDSLTSKIRNKSIELGFSAIGFSKATALKEDGQKLHDWLENGNHADMHWMTRHADLRIDPEKLMATSNTIISVILNYRPAHKQPPDVPQIAKYAYGRDYHKVIKKKLFRLIDYMKEIEPHTQARAFVDSAPVLEHAWARKSGLGWIGKHSLLINRKWGSYILIGEVFTNLELTYNQHQEIDLCGSCTKCIDACPTNAITQPYVVDARKCISYHTIENKNELPTSLQPQFQNWVFGCDICQDICPYNKKTPEHNEPDFEPRFSLLNMTKEKWANLSGQEFYETFNGTPVMRAKYEGLQRNIRFINDKKTESKSTNTNN
ncbi:MAG: tRNA epoxyqueuosine(34) reductase QueG [Bacteroidetes bacterium]|jgi:epoxyqueuosine reductase|nr:tRNA epoxyqueuosine(34) reductase QueG [Bacteroidota bacterium]